MSVPMDATTIESLSPVYSIVCSDIISEYISKKEQHLNPSLTLDSADKVTGCISKCAESVKETPCLAIQQSFQECLGKEEGRVPCKPIKYMLEECTAKHFSKF